MIILACATERELREMLAGLKKPVESGAVRVAGRRILPCVTGVGPVAAGISAGEALARHPEAAGMINAGICGSFDPERFPLGGICVARKEVWPEYGVRANVETTLLDYPMFPDMDLDAANELRLDPVFCAGEMNLRLPEAWCQGVSLTVAGVSGGPGRADFLRERYGAATENMEGFALALAARRRGIPFLEIRTVSNLAGERDKKKWNFRQAFASLRSVLPMMLESA